MSESSFTEPSPDETPSFVIADAPPSFSIVTAPSNDDDLTCEVCGTPLVYGGRGRKPKRCDEHKKSGARTSTGTRRSSTRDVDAALAALEGFETILQFGLMWASPHAAADFETRRESLTARNQKILEADPALAKRLSSAASKGGGFALVLSYGIAFGPAVLIARRDLIEQADAQAMEQEAEHDPEAWRHQ